MDLGLNVKLRSKRPRPVQTRNLGRPKYRIILEREDEVTPGVRVNSSHTTFKMNMVEDTPSLRERRQYSDPSNESRRRSPSSVILVENHFSSLRDRRCDSADDSSRGKSDVTRHKSSQSVLSTLLPMNTCTWLVNLTAGLSVNRTTASPFKFAGAPIEFRSPFVIAVQSRR